MLLYSGTLVLKLVYGEKFEEKSSELGGLMIFLSLVNVAWLLCAIFLLAGIAANDAAFCIAMIIGYPAIIAIWAVRERKKS